MNFKVISYRVPMFYLEYSIKSNKSIGKGVEIYTDGSKMENLVFCTYIVFKQGIGVLKKTLG